MSEAIQESPIAIPQAERVRGIDGTAVSTEFAISHWVVPNDLPMTDLYQSVIAGYDFQIEFFCREVVHNRTVFLNRTTDGFETTAWCDSPPAGW